MVNVHQNGYVLVSDTAKA